MNRSSSEFIPMRMILKPACVPILVDRLAGRRPGTKESLTRTSQWVSSMPTDDSSEGELWPATTISGLLRKRRTKASRKRRFSISKKACMDETGAQSFIDNLSLVPVPIQLNREGQQRGPLPVDRARRG